MSGAALFCVLATFNAAGYRYGVSDQAFYVPAIFLSVDPSLYPHDSSLIRAQGDLIVFDEVCRILSHATSWSLPTLFFVGYLASLLLLLATAAAVGRTLYRSWWTVVALGFALTLRHRITATAVNTLEGYLHPRMLAFAIGVGALLAFVRGRSWTALALAAAAGFFPSDHRALVHRVDRVRHIRLRRSRAPAPPRVRSGRERCGVLGAVLGPTPRTAGPDGRHLARRAGR